MSSLRKVALFGMLAVMLFIIAMCAAVMPKDDPSSCVSGDVGSLTVKGARINEEQSENAAIIVDVAEKKGLSSQAAPVAIMAAIQESGLENLDYGYPGSSSLGLFQQIEAWGPRKVRMNPRKSTNMFYFGGRGGQRGLTDVPGWESLSPGDAAQAVQGSGFPDAYDQHQPEAQAIVSALMGESTQTSGDDCEETDTLEKVVLYALSRKGEPYKWDDDDEKNGSGLITEAFSSVGIKMPTKLVGLNSLASYQEVEKDGVDIEIIDGDDITSSDQLKRADIVLYSTDDDDEPERAGLELGDIGDPANAINVATYNGLGSNHTTVANARLRMQTAVAQITSKDHPLDVVGLQELRPDQRAYLLELTKGQYDIYPKPPSYDAKQMSVNSIIWDATKFELVSGKATPMPFYYDGKKFDIPLIQLRQKSTGLVFYVVNTHDPSKHEFDYLRVKNAQEHLRLMEELMGEGVPVFFPGDFNSGSAMRTTTNRTLNNDPANLTWRIMTKNGTVVNGYDAWKGRTGLSQKTVDELGQGEVDHVYVSNDVTVTDYQVVEKNTGSDHPIVYVTATLGGRDPPSGTVVVGTDGKTVGLQTVDLGSIVTVLRPTALEAFSGGEWQLPIPKGSYTITAIFGQPGPLWASGFHTGLDFEATEGTPIGAVTGGKIVSAEYSGSYGNRIIVELQDGSQFWYCHMTEFALTSGDVAAGTTIGYVGSTGNVTGPHLHLEVRQPDGTGIDPMQVLQLQGLDP